MKRTILMLAALALFLGGVGQAKADTAVTLGSYFDYTNGSWTLGFEFSPKTNIQVTSLGSFFPAGATDVHGVSLWDTNQNLLATTFVTGTGTEGFAYSPIAPVTLTAGQDYVVGATTLSDAYAIASGPFTVAPGITYIEHAEVATAGVVPQYPTNFYNNFDDFGANFQFNPGTVVPEPSSLTLLGIGAFGLLGYVRRRRKAAAV